MSLPTETKDKIAKLLIRKVRDKLRKYKAETNYTPFHHRLLGKGRYAMFSFMHSLNTTFGMSLWEQIAVILARGKGSYAERQHKLLGEINSEAEEFINNIHYRLREGNATPNMVRQVEEIRNRIKKGQAKRDPDSVVDLLIQRNQEENYIDVTSVKPNKKEFVALKLKLLRWVALRLSQDKNVQVFTRLAIPYNPYHPAPYKRWTSEGLYDWENGEVLVGEDFWNFVAGDSIYDDILDVFQKAGEELRTEIDKKFAEFRNLT